MKIFSKYIVYSLLTAACFCGLVSCDSQKDTENKKQKPEKIVPVAIEVIKRENLAEIFTLPASLEAWEDLTLAAEISGVVQKINFKEGDRVEAGEILLEIDPDTVKSYLARDQENVDVLERKLARYQQLEAEGLISQQELDDLKNALTAAKANLQTTRLKLAKSFPKAPVTGHIDHLFIDRGEYVDPGMPLLRLVDVTTLKVIADIPEKDVHFLKTGQKVKIIPTTQKSSIATSIVGKINFIAYSADPVTRTYQAKIIIDNQRLTLRPGMIVRVEFIRQQLNQVIAVPLFAVMDRDGEKIVFVEKEGIVHKARVTTGRSIGQKIVIKAGLAQGQHLIIKGQQLLTEGVRVEEETL